MRAIIALIFIVVLGAGWYWAYRRYGPPPAAVETIAAADYDKELRAFQAMKGETPSAAPASEADFQALADALTKANIATMSFDSIEADDNMAVAKGVVITAIDNPDIGARIEKLQLWGVDAAALAGLASSQATDGIDVAERVDARGVEWFGLDDITESATKAYLDLITDVMEQNAPGSEALFDHPFAAEKYNFAVGRMILKGLHFYPVDPAPADGDDGDLLSMVRKIARANLFVGVDASAAYDLTIDMAMKQMGQKTDMDFSAPLAGLRGWRRGDLDFAVMKGAHFDMTIGVSADANVSDENGATDATAASISPLISMNTSGGIDLYAMEGVRLAKVYDYLARGEWPSKTETDFMSLGVWRYRGLRYAIDGEPFYSIGEVVYDLSHFYWLAPTQISIRAEDAVYNFVSMLNWINKMAATARGNDAAVETIDNVIAVMQKNGLDAISGDGEFDVAWNPKNGEAELRYLGDVDDWGRFDFETEGALPNFNAFAGLAPAEGEDFDVNALESLLRDKSALNKFLFLLTDHGGIQKGFAMAIDFAELAPEGDASVAMLRGADPTDLRVSIAGMIRLTAAQAAQSFPPARDYVIAIADFIQKGGALRIEANPPTPITAALLESEEANFQTDPERAIKVFGFTLTQEPVEEDAAAKN